MEWIWIGILIGIGLIIAPVVLTLAGALALGVAWGAFWILLLLGPIVGGAALGGYMDSQITSRDDLLWIVGGLLGSLISMVVFHVVSNRGEHEQSYSALPIETVGLTIIGGVLGLLTDYFFASERYLITLLVALLGLGIGIFRSEWRLWSKS